MAEYFALQIILGKLDYTVVVTKKPELREAIGVVLTEKGRTDLIVS